MKDDARIEAGWALAVAVVTAGWVAAALAGAEPPLVDTDLRGTAAAAATAALAGAGWRPRTPVAAAGAGAGLVLLPAAVAAAAGGGSALLLTAALAGAAAAELAVTIRQRPPARGPATMYAVGLAAGAGALVAAVLVERQEWTSTSLPTDDVTAAGLGLIAAGLLVVVATLGPLRARPLAVPGLLVGLVAVNGLSPLGVAAVAALVAPAWAWRVPSRPTPALAALAVAAAALPLGSEPPALLAAAAALALVVTHPATAFLGLPGAAALAALLVTTEPGAPLILLAGGLAVTAMVLALRGGPAWGALAAEARQESEGIIATVPAGVLALWLVLSPGSWGWTGAEGLGTYDRGALVAAAAVGLFLVGRRSLEHLSTTPLPVATRRGRRPGVTPGLGRHRGR